MQMSRFRDIWNGIMKQSIPAKSERSEKPYAGRGHPETMLRISCAIYMDSSEKIH